MSHIGNMKPQRQLDTVLLNNFKLHFRWSNEHNCDYNHLLAGKRVNIKSGDFRAVEYC